MPATAMPAIMPPRVVEVSVVLLDNQIDACTADRTAITTLFYDGCALKAAAPVP